MEIRDMESKDYPEIDRLMKELRPKKQDSVGNQFLKNPLDME